MGLLKRAVVWKESLVSITPHKRRRIYLLGVLTIPKSLATFAELLRIDGDRRSEGAFFNLNGAAGGFSLRHGTHVENEFSLLRFTDNSSKWIAIRSNVP